MKVAVDNGIKLKKNSRYELSWKITMDESGAENFRMIRMLAFNSMFLLFEASYVAQAEPSIGRIQECGKSLIIAFQCLSPF